MFITINDVERVVRVSSQISSLLITDEFSISHLLDSYDFNQ